MNFLGLEFSNPFIVASGPLTRSLEFIKRAEEAGASSVSTKLALPRLPYNSQLRCYSIPGMGLIEPTDSRLTMEESLELIQRVREETSLVVFANISGVEAEDWGEMAKSFEKAGAHIIEANFCCPHLGFTKHLSTDEMSGNLIGGSIGHVPVVAGKVTKMLKNSVSIPVVCKLPPSNFLLETALACEKNSADAIHIIGGPFLGLPPVDVYRKGKPLYPLMEGAAFGSHMGAWIKNSTYRYVAEVARKLNVPIIASGGIQNWQDSINMIMWGASMVSACTEIMFNGFDVVTEIVKDLKIYMERVEIKEFSEIRGLSLSYLREPEQVKLIPGSARIQYSLCKKCGQCLKPGHCNAISLREDGFPVINEKLCLGCGVCESLCRYRAIKMEAF